MAEFSDILAQVGMARLHDMSVAPQDTIPEDVRDQAKRTLEDNRDILEKLAAEIDSVVDPAVRAASVAKIGQCVEAEHMFSGWRDKAEFWTLVHCPIIAMSTLIITEKKSNRMSAGTSPKGREHRTPLRHRHSQRRPILILLRSPLQVSLELPLFHVIDDSQNCKA